jgi:uncharacterized protein YbjT (DUF2867 family)
MKVAVVGGTGAVGQHVVSVLAERGHEPVVLARSHGVDVTTGDGLDSALEGAGAVIDVVSVATTKRDVAVDFFTAEATTLGRAAVAAGVERLVVLSVVGIDRAASFGYYAGKLRQEEIVHDGPLPAVVIRATQFHEFAGQVLDRARIGKISAVPKMRVQPIAARTVAEHLAGLAVSDSVGRSPDLAGPRPESLGAMVRAVLRADGRGGRVLDVRLPGSAGKAMAGGALLPGPDTLLDGPDFATWLATRYPA